MTYPNQQPQFTQPGYPQQPPPPGYPPQGYQAPYPPQGYPAQYPPQIPQAPAQPPAQPLARGSLDAFYNQPVMGGAPNISKFFKDPADPTGRALKQFGTYIDVVVARNATHADVRQQTDLKGNPKTFKNGDPQFVLVVPLTVAPSPEFPEGEASWWIKGRVSEELKRAMSEAGVEGAPQGGARVRITLAGQRPIRNMSPETLYSLQYTPPQGGAPVPVTAPPQPQEAPQAAQAAQPAPVVQPQFTQPAAAVAPTGYATGVNGQPAQPAPVQPQFTQPAVNPPTGYPAGLTQEQIDHLAVLQGGQQPQQ